MIQDLRRRRRKRVDRFTRVSDWVHDYSPELAAGASLLCGTLSGWLRSITWMSFLFVIGTLVFGLIAGIGVQARARSVSSYDRQLEASEYNYRKEIEKLRAESQYEREVVRRLLGRISQTLMEEAGIWAEGTARLSIYGHVSKEFFLIRRMSSDPIKAKPGRSVYPEDQGHIGFAWQKGVLDESGWQKATARRRALEKGMPESVVDNLSLIPRNMVGRRIDGEHGDPVGIVLLESSEPYELNDVLDHLESSKTFSLLCDAVALSENIFEPLSASQEHT